MYILTMAGRFDEAHDLASELFQSGGEERPGAVHMKFGLACLEALCGDIDAAREHLVGCNARAESDDVQERANYASAEATVLLASSDSRRALETARRAIDEATGSLGLAHEAIRVAFPVAVEAAIGVGDLEQAERLAELLATRPRGEVPPFLRAQVTRAKALVAGARGEGEAVEENLVAAEATFRDLGYPYWTARAQLDRAEWLARQGRLDESAGLAGEAAATFDTVGAPPMLSRARALLEPEMVRKPGADGERAIAQSSLSPSE
jgi:ATP/maltotriose-dependent transcriptional regulator MalT